MSAYIKELCLRYARNELTVIQKVDIDIGVKRLRDTKQITDEHVYVSWKYLSGYSLVELQITYPNAEALLIQFFSLLAETIDYTDEHLLQMLIRKNPKRAKTVEADRRKMESYGRTFE